MSALVGTFNFSDQVDGDTLELTNINFYDSGDLPVDMSSVSSVDMKVRKKNEKGKLVDTLTIGTGIKWVDQSLGQLRIGDTDDLVQVGDWDGAADYYYDIQFTYSTGIIRTYLKGKIPVIKDTTY